LVILAADSIVALIPEFNLNITKCVIITLILPLTFSRNLNIAAYGSLLGVIAILNLMGIIFFFGFSTNESPGSLLQTAETNIYPNWNRLPFSFGLIMAGFCGHAVFPNVRSI
jgi:vesicular inhibitory amino acid transporter